MPFVLETGRVLEATADLMLRGRLFAPVARRRHFVFDRIANPGDVRLDAPQTVHSAKLGLFPPSEPLLHFDLVSHSWRATPDQTPVVLFGIHPCDSWGLDAFDRWMNDGIPDDVYVRRRERTLVIGVACGQPCNESSFCGAMGTHSPLGADLWLWPIEGGWLLDPRTRRGEETVSRWQPLVREASAEESGARERMETQRAAAFDDLGLDLPGLPKSLQASARAAWWQDMAERCVDCGQCVAVCPTCTCFGMRDSSTVALDECTRERVWDGCMFETFAEVAGGHNFRRDRSARLRHRMSRKGNWLNDKFGVPFCTGCGRCAATCPVGISPILVFRKAQGHDVTL